MVLVSLAILAEWPKREGGWWAQGDGDGVVARWLRSRRVLLHVGIIVTVVIYALLPEHLLRYTCVAWHGSIMQTI